MQKKGKSFCFKRLKSYVYIIDRGQPILWLKTYLYLGCGQKGSQGSNFQVEAHMMSFFMKHGALTIVYLLKVESMTGPVDQSMAVCWVKSLTWVDPHGTPCLWFQKFEPELGRNTHCKDSETRLEPGVGWPRPDQALQSKNYWKFLEDSPACLGSYPGSTPSWICLDNKKN